MFCPGCGLEDKQSNQFCRACGTDLRTVRTAIERPDKITESAISARDEIGRAVAAKIREARSAAELSVVADEVLPQVEKFLESPSEKRLRRIRAGMVLSSIGVGTAVAITIAGIAMKEPDVFFLAALGVICFFIGVGIILNGLLLTVPRGEIADRSSDADRQRELDSRPASTSDLALPEAPSLFSSVTENTTQHLKEKTPVERD
ncbi:MAG TPA: hypothetical protein VFZ23_08105 [Pyrinomonadaceae bacterium]